MDINIVFRIIYLLLWFLFLVSRIIPSRGLPSLDQSRSEKRGKIREEGWSMLFTLIMSWYGNIIVAILYILNPPWMLWSYIYLPLELRFLGVISGVILVPYTYWVGRTLAQNYSYTVEIQEGQNLITTGPYKRIRHPIYASAIFFLAALVVISDNWLFLVVLVLIIPGLYIRMKKEELVMMKTFGESYLVYMKQTGRIFPKIRQDR